MRNMGPFNTSTSELFLSWSPLIIVVSLLIAGYYIYITGPGMSKFKDATPVSTRKKASFLSGIFLFILAEGSPISNLGHYLFLVHMTQQTIIYLAVPPLILAGIPAWLVKPIFKVRILYHLLSFFTKPLFAIVLFNTIFSFYHIPFIFDLIMSNILYIKLSVTILLPTAFFMWWPIFSPIDKFNTLKPLHKVAYIFGMGMLLTPACALIIFSKDILYTTYLDVPRLFGISLLDDQQSGGIVMKIMQEFIYGAIIAVIFTQWIKYDRKNTEEEDRKNWEKASQIQ